MTRIVLLALAGGALAIGCSAVVPRIEHPSRRDEPDAPDALAIGAVAITREGGEPVVGLGTDGAIEHPRCPGRLERDGTVRDPAGAIVIRLGEGGEITRGDGRALFTIEGAALRRADGRRAVLEGDRLTLEASPDAAFTVAREGADDRTVLVLFAALAACEAG